MPPPVGDHRREEEEVAEAVRQKLQAAVATGHNYRSIAAFTAFMAAYLALLWLQASAYHTSAVVATLRSLLLPGGATATSLASGEDLLGWVEPPACLLRGGATTTSFASGEEVLGWVEGQLVGPFWRDPVCGDGACERPFEFPAFGRFGCKADCGVEENTTRLVVKVRSNFAGHPLLAPRLLMAAARWNLCLQDNDRRQRGDPDLCWFEADQGFTEVAATRLEAVDVVDGSWYIWVLGDHAGRVQGAVYSLLDPEQPEKLALQPDWVGCKMPRRGQVASAQAAAAAVASQRSSSSGGGSSRQGAVMEEGEEQSS